MSKRPQIDDNLDASGPVEAVLQQDAKRSRQPYSMLPLSEDSKELVRWTAGYCGDTQADVLNAISSSAKLEDLVRDICADLVEAHDTERQAEREEKLGKANADNGGALDPSGTPEP